MLGSVWEQIQDVRNNQIMPTVQQLIATFNQVKPELSMLAEFIGGVLVVAFGLVVGAIGGFIGAIAGIARGIAEGIGGVVQIVGGFIQTISGILSFILVLFTAPLATLPGAL